MAVTYTEVVVPVVLDTTDKVAEYLFRLNEYSRLRNQLDAAKNRLLSIRNSMGSEDLLRVEEILNRSREG